MLNPRDIAENAEEEEEDEEEEEEQQQQQQEHEQEEEQEEGSVLRKVMDTDNSNNLQKWLHRN